LLITFATDWPISGLSPAIQPKEIFFLESRQKYCLFPPSLLFPPDRKHIKDPTSAPNYPQLCLVNQSYIYIPLLLFIHDTLFYCLIPILTAIIMKPRTVLRYSNIITQKTMYIDTEQLHIIVLNISLIVHTVLNGSTFNQQTRKHVSYFSPFYQALVLINIVYFYQ
jgi:hypothetical protein